MLVGDAMAAAGDAEVARSLCAHPPTSAKYAAAQSRLAWSLQRAGQSESGAEARPRRDGTGKDNPAGPVALRRPPARERPLQRLHRGDGPADLARRRRGRGLAASTICAGWRWSALGRWDRAEPDLREALKLNPNDPDVMNYLGFGWANRFQNLDEALALLQKAAALRPRSGEIRDSLGWARYRQACTPTPCATWSGRWHGPAEPDVNDHLGDAYWQVGRKLEAEFQWRRVLTLNPDDKLRGEAAAKIEQGLRARARDGRTAGRAPARARGRRGDGDVQPVIPARDRRRLRAGEGQPLPPHRSAPAPTGSIRCAA